MRDNDRITMEPSSQPDNKKLAGDLLFVYNADSGFGNILRDTLIKIFRPESYPCNLCRITYGNFGMKRAWRSFIETSGLHARFVHRDEFHAEFPGLDPALPTLLIRNGKSVSILITAKEMNAIRNIPELIRRIRDALSAYSSSA